MEAKRVMRHTARAVLAVATAACLGSQASGQEAAGGETEAAAEATQVAEPTPQEELIDPEAKEPVRRMVQALQGAKSLSYEGTTEWDVIQDDGEAIEFGARNRTVMRRPDRFFTERSSREGKDVRVYYDGKTLTVYNQDGNVYASTPRTGDLDALTDFLRDDVGLKLPLADLFASDLGTLVVENVIAARYVGEEDLDGVPVEHIALRNREGAGIQLWIEKEKALPRRIVINFELARGRPQFRADFREWKVDPRAGDGTFEFDPPKQARAIPFVFPKRTASAGGEATR
jgi:hypothetical protein